MFLSGVWSALLLQRPKDTIIVSIMGRGSTVKEIKIWIFLELAMEGRENNFVLFFFFFFFGSKVNKTPAIQIYSEGNARRLSVFYVFQQMQQ